MALAEACEAAQDPGRIGAEVAALKNARDNVTNFIHIARVYAIILGTVGLAVTWFNFRAESGASPLWDLPVVAFAALLIGASQHQLGGAGHEATHFSLFRNRNLNELASDWLCMFPLYATTYQFRLHHLAHHQFVNDPTRDPDISQLRDSGHDLDFPMPQTDILKALLRQLWLPNLIRYALVRARYSAIGVDHNPYHRTATTAGPGPEVIVGLNAVVIPLILNTVGLWVGPSATAAAFLIVGAVAGAALAMCREQSFKASLLRPVVSHKTTAIGRVAFFTLLYASLSATEAATGAPAWGYFAVLWILPLFTTFPFFMIMRQWVQHGNADRGRLTNTRIFVVNPLLRYAVFPFGMDYHLPHHIYAAVPHYKLPDLHKLLVKRDAAYAREAVVVDGYFWSQSGEHPSVLDALAAGHTPHTQDVFIASDTLDDADIEDPTKIRLAEAASRAAARHA
jgi:fatty acid desaturase